MQIKKHIVILVSLSKPDSLESELRAVLKVRRQNIYAESDTFKSEKSPHSKVHW